MVICSKKKECYQGHYENVEWQIIQRMRWKDWGNERGRERTFTGKYGSTSPRLNF